MKKFLFSLAVATMGVVAMAADTDLLVWDINTYENDNLDGAMKGTPFSSISQFYLVSTKDPSARINIGDYTYSDLARTQLDQGLTSGIGTLGPYGMTESIYYTDFGKLLSQNNITANDYEAYEFIMQLDNNGNMVAWSEDLFNPNSNPLLLSAVVGNVFNTSQIGNMQNPETEIRAFSFNFGSHLVPEPTSGLLMMLGAGLLALRRRRRA